MTWRPTDTVTLDANAVRVIEPSSISRNNYHTRSSYDLGMSLKMLERLRLTLSGTYENIDLENALTLGPASVEKEDDVLTGRARIDYAAPADFLSLFASVEYSDLDSSLEDQSYQRTLVSTGVVLQY